MISIFSLLVPASVLALLLSEILIIFSCYGLAAYAVPDVGSKFLWEQSGWARIAVAAIAIVLGLYFRQLYANLRIRSRILLSQQLVLIMGMMFLLEALLAYWNANWALPRTVLISGSALTVTCLLIWRILFSVAIRSKVGLQRVLFLGWSPASLELAQYFSRHYEVGFTSIGYLDAGDAEQVGTEIEVARLGTAAQLFSVVEEHHPDWIVLARRSAANVRRAYDFAELRFGGVQTEDAARFYEKTLGRVCSGQIRPEALIFSESLQPEALKVRLQSMYIYAMALVAAPLILFLMGATALFVSATSRGPVLLREQRVGLHGVPFTMYWFSLDRGLLRRLGLHALPQVWHVLRGQMSFIGPQADRPEFAALLDQIVPFYAQRTAVRPGMTGWAQISQIPDESTGDALRRLEYDMYYIKNMSFLLDVFILFRWIRDTLLSADSVDA
ncbi:MAG TPA: sugar transferase [Bryobacteraceae bacterium]|jgi:lipopolysaccharide/colanic/teichoic acid biosynthesis glycosyltransferase